MNRPLVKKTGALAFLLLVVTACDLPASPAPSSGAAAGSGAPGPAGASVSAPAAAEVEVGPASVDAIHEYTGGAKAGDAVPLVVAIHGLGDQPRSFKGLFEGFRGKAHLVIPAGGVSWGDGFAWWPIRGAIDEKNMAAGIEAPAERLVRAIRSWQVGSAPGKTIVTGFSQGGMLSFALATQYPADIAEAVPIAGLLPPSMVPAVWPAGAPMPRFVALHGDADARVPFALGKRSVESLKALGVPAELRSYPGVMHAITPEMRSDLFAILQAALERAAKAE